jgi:hypothetical protein
MAQSHKMLVAAGHGWPAKFAITITPMKLCVATHLHSRLGLGLLPCLVLLGQLGHNGIVVIVEGCAKSSCDSLGKHWSERGVDAVCRSKNALLAPD